MHQTFHVEALGLQSQLMRWHKKRAMHVMIYYIADMEGAYFTIANHALVPPKVLCMIEHNPPNADLYPNTT